MTAEVSPDLKGEVLFHLLLLTTFTLRLEFGRDLSCSLVDILKLILDERTNSCCGESTHVLGPLSLLKCLDLSRQTSFFPEAPRLNTTFASERNVSLFVD